MTPEEIQSTLNTLAELYSARDTIALEKQALIESVITPEIRARLAEIEAEFAPMQDAAAEKIAELEGKAKDAVLHHGASVKGAHITAVYTKGRVSWDTKKLDGLMIALPQLASCRSEGAPSVSLRKS